MKRMKYKTVMLSESNSGHFVSQRLLFAIRNCNMFKVYKRNVTVVLVNVSFSIFENQT